MKPYTFCPHCGSRLVTKQFGGGDRLACPDESCGFVFWDNPLPVVAAIVEHEGKVLLARNRAWPPKMFGLVTGFLEKDEEPVSAVGREVREELGLEALSVDFVGLYPFFQQNQLLIVYHVTASGEITLGEELAEIRLLPPEKVRPWPFGTGIALGDWLEKTKGVRQ